MVKHKYITPKVELIVIEETCNQYWVSGWRNNDGTIVDQGKLPDGTDWDGTTKVDSGNSYWKGGWGQNNGCKTSLSEIEIDDW